MTNQIEIPEDVSKIINRLNWDGFEAFVVGGAVRDSVLGIAPKDWDVCTDATPTQMKLIFDGMNLIPTGEEFGTMTLLLNDVGYEITTYRKDGRYSDSRRPDDVSFAKTLGEDLSRRDITINAMAYHPSKGLVDPHGGMNDIRRNLVRAVGDAQERFSEDPLRMIRAIRISEKYGFQIEVETFNAIKDNAEKIQNISAERVREELNKIVLIDPNGIDTLEEIGLLEFIIPELHDCFEITQNNFCHKFDVVAHHIIESMNNVDAELHLRLAMMFHDIGKAVTKTIDENGISHFYGHEEVSALMSIEIMHRLKYDNHTIEIVSRLIAGHMRTLHPTRKSIRKTLNAVGEDIFDDLVKVQMADDFAKDTHNKDVREWISNSAQSLIIASEIIADNECFKVSDLAIDGNDVMSLGVIEGREVGRILNELLEYVLENPEKNESKWLIPCVYVLIDGGTL